MIVDIRNIDVYQAMQHAFQAISMVVASYVVVVAELPVDAAAAVVR
jgi:hypothetical protein